MQLDGDLVGRDNFPLPGLGPKLERLSWDIHHGKGFGLLRGLNPDNYCVEDLSIIHLGIQAYIADRQGRQDKRGNMLGKSRNSRSHHYALLTTVKFTLSRTTRQRRAASTTVTRHRRL